jgi:MFS family permease
VLAGLVSAFLADTFGLVAPFLAAIVPLTILSIPILTSWTENYGDSSVALTQTFAAAAAFLRARPTALLLGLAQSAFEGAMYAFVFLWTPALTAARGASSSLLPFGVIFAAFMVCVMVGSYCFAILTRTRPVAQMPFLIHLLAAGAMLAAAVTDSEFTTYVAFLVFEASCGMFWPTYGTLRSQHIPEVCRAAISNIFRIPLNAFVLVLLLNSGKLPTETMFLVCAGAHISSLVLYFLFNASATKTKSVKSQ